MDIENRPHRLEANRSKLGFVHAPRGGANDNRHSKYLVKYLIYNKATYTSRKNMKNRHLPDYHLPVAIPLAIDYRKMAGRNMKNCHLPDYHFPVTISFGMSIPPILIAARDL